MKANSDSVTNLSGEHMFQENPESFLQKFSKAKIDFDSLAENINEGLARCEIICDESGSPVDYRILSTNSAFEKHTGLKREVCTGKTILEVFPNVEKSWIETYGRVALTQNAETITGYNHNTKRHYRSTAYSDKPGEFMMLFKDTTDQVELEKTYELVINSTKKSEDLLNNMQEAYKKCKVICDEQGEPIDFKILEVNPAYAQHVGVEAKQIVGKTMLQVFPNADIKKIKGFCEVGLSGESKSFIDHCNQTNRVFDISAFSPRIGEFVLFIRDVTAKERARIKMEEAYKKIEESEKLKSAFLANMSHEIRTPLNAILGFAEMLEDKKLEEVDQQKCLDNIKNSGNRLLNIVSDILDISKLEANQQQLNYGVHNLNEIIDGLREQFKIINIDPSLEITSTKGLSDEEAFIETDATRLEQILSNLLENALKHTEKGSIRFGYEHKNDNLQFFVADTGSGIEKKDQKTIFERFGQVNNETEINKGTGLGIPIAAGFTHLFGGKMWVDSEPEQGSTFFFTIPYTPKSDPNPQDKKPTILVAEDEEANFMLLEMWLKKHCNLIHAYDGNETIALFNENEQVDLVLMDIKMPYLNGIEATKKIRKTNGRTPIIAQTAFVMEDEKMEILAAGCDEILSKPIRKQQFQELLTKYIPGLKFA